MPSKSIHLLVILCSISVLTHCRTKAELEPSARAYYESVKEIQRHMSESDSNKNQRQVKSNPDILHSAKSTGHKSEHLFEEEKFSLASLMPKYKPDNLVPSSTYTLLCLSGLYLVFFAYKKHRIVVIILGFYTVYFWMVFTIVQTQMYRSELISYQFVSYSFFVILGFVVSILTSLYRKIEYLVTGMATAAAFSLYLAQFCMDLSTFMGDLWFVAIFLAISILFSVIYACSEFSVLKHICPFIGASVTVIYIGIIMGDLESLEYDEDFKKERITLLWKYLIIASIFGCFGLYLQTRQQMKTIEKIREDVLNDFSDCEGWSQ